MSNANIEQLIAASTGGVGDNTRDEVLKREILRQIITTEADSLSVGTQVVGTQQMDRRSVEFTYPEHTTAEYPVSMDTNTDRQYIEWSDFKIRLKRGQTRYFMSDGAKLEGMGDVHAERMRQRASEALARRKDENILGTLANGAFSENTDSVSNAWDTTDGEIIDDLWAMWRDVVINSPLNSMDIQNMSVVLPAEIYAEVNKLELINQVQQRVRDYLGQAFNFTLYPHKIGLDEAPMHVDDRFDEQYPDTDLRDMAVMVLPGSDTAIHGELSPEVAASAGVPLVEQQREFGKGEDYLISEWFNTAILEHESGSGGETPRIATRTAVNSNAS